MVKRVTDKVWKREAAKNRQMKGRARVKRRKRRGKMRGSKGLGGEIVAKRTDEGRKRKAREDVLPVQKLVQALR